MIYVSLLINVILIFYLTMFWFIEKSEDNLILLSYGSIFFDVTIIPNLYRELIKTNKKLILIFLNFMFITSNILGVLIHSLKYEDHSKNILNIFAFYFHLVMSIFGFSGILYNIHYKSNYATIT